MKKSRRLGYRAGLSRRPPNRRASISMFKRSTAEEADAKDRGMRCRVVIAVSLALAVAPLSALARVNAPRDIYLGSPSDLPFDSPTHNLACDIRNDGPGWIVECLSYSSRMSAQLGPSKRHVAIEKIAAGAVVDERHGILPYGASASFHGFTCVSRLAGITCRKGGAGIFVSAASVRRV